MVRTRLAVGLAALILLSGCRLYGGYNTTTLSIEAVQEAAASTESLAVALAADAQAVAAGRALPPLYAQAYADLAADARAAADEAAGRAAQLTEDGAGYRGASRALGAIVSVRRTLEARRTGLLRATTSALGRSVTPLGEEGRYQAVPAYYVRNAADGPRTAAELIGGGR